MLVSNQRCHLVQIVPLVQSVVRLVLRWVQSVLGTINRVQHGKPIRVIAAASSQMVRDNVSKHLFFAAQEHEQKEVVKVKEAVLICLQNLRRIWQACQSV